MVCSIALLLMSSFWGCDSGLHSLRAFEELEPIEALPEPTPDQNLMVKINNVADFGTSFRNRAELFINGKRIRLNKGVVGYRRDYHFHFRLKTGVYKVEAKYYAVLGRYEEKYDITTRDGKFRIYPDQRTVVSIRLDKKLNGDLKSKKNYFMETYVPLSANMPHSKVAPSVERPIRVPGTGSIGLMNNTDRKKSTGHYKFPNIIWLQINTDTVSAKIYIDGKFMGTSPLNVKVDRSTNHIVQLSREGYQTKVKYLNVKELKDKDRYQLRETLKRNGG
jgi:hypothetical protein